MKGFFAAAVCILKQFLLSESDLANIFLPFPLKSSSIIHGIFCCLHTPQSSIKFIGKNMKAPFSGSLEHLPSR